MDFMALALEEARKAGRAGEVPVGCVIARDGRVIAKGRNQREQKQNALLHAEVTAINRACRRLRSWRLSDCQMYVTLEPCQMCLGAAVNARIKKIFVGARSTSDLNWETETEFTDNPECRDILTQFFREKR